MADRFFDARLWRLARSVRGALAATIGLGFLGGILTVAQARYLSHVIDAAFLAGATLSQLRPWLVGLLIVVLLRGLALWGGEVAAQRVAGRVKMDLRGRLVAHLAELGPAYGRGERSGELSNTLVEGIEALDAYFSQYLPQLALAALVPLTILVFVFPLDAISGGVFLLTAPLIPVFMMLIGSLADALTRRQWGTLSRMSAHFLDVLQGLTTLKLFGRSRDQIEVIRLISERFRDTTMSVLRVTFLSALVLELVATLSTAVVAVEIGLRLLYGHLAFEQALLILILAPEFYLPLRTLGLRFHAGITGVSAARRIFEILDTPARRGQSTAALPAQPHIRFEEVRYAYDGGERAALDGVSFEIRPGQTVALTGPSGGGKSTVGQLLLRFSEPTGGRITVDGLPLAGISPADWRRLVAWVPQDPYLFYGTVAENIRLGRPAATGDQVIAAATRAHVHDFISALPQGYDTLIGERGARLSGGEAQRVALARAFLKDAPFVILDEATANLDPEHEALVQEAMERLLAGRTALVITHHLNLAARADQVVVLAGGRVVEAGSHEELLSQEGGLYRRLVEAQGGGQESRPVWGYNNANRGRGRPRIPHGCTDDAVPSLLDVSSAGHVGNRLKERRWGRGGPCGRPRVAPNARSRAAARARKSVLRFGEHGISDHHGARILRARWSADPRRGGDSSQDDIMEPRPFADSPVPPASHSPIPPLSHSPTPPFPPPPFLRLLSFVAPFWPWVALSVLLGFATVSSGIGLMAASAWIIASAALHPSVAVLEVAIVGVRFFGLARGVFRYLERLVSHQVTFRLLARLRVWFYAALEPLAPARLLQYRSGDLLARIVADIETLEHFYVRVLAPPAVAVLVAAGMWAFMASYDPRLAQALLVFLLAAGVGVPLLTRLLSRGTSRRLVAARGDLNALLLDGIQGLADLLACGQERSHQDRIERASARIVRLQGEVAVVSGLYAALGSVLTGLAMLAVLALAVPMVAAGHIDGVSLAVLTLATAASFEAVLPLSQSAQSLETSLAAAGRLFEIVDVGSLASTATASGADAGPCDPARPAALAIEVRDLTFRYASGQAPALDGVSFTLPAGRRIAVVGPSGAGKSTLVNVLLGFWDYREGTIRVGGRDLHTYDGDELRAAIGVVSQRTHLFNASVRENLLLARPAASAEEMMEAARLAQIHDFIAGLPQGYETWIGEQGLRLSGGERQRLAIARALLKNAPILILDEATANLDALTEKAVRQSVQALMVKRTTLTITHRLAGLEDVDDILVLRAGRIAERGRHAELLAAGGVYRRMWERQAQMAALESVEADLRA